MLEKTSHANVKNYFIKMEISDYQEFVAQDFLAVNSQSIFTKSEEAPPLQDGVSLTTDTAILSGSLIGTELKSEQLAIVDSSVFKDIEPFLDSSAERLQLDKKQNSRTDEINSTRTLDSLMPNREIERRENRQFVRQFDTLTGSDYSITNSQSLLNNSGFDLALDGTNWLVGKTGKVRDYDQNVESVAHIDNVAGQGRQMYLKLPEEAKINYQDQLSLFQDVSGLKTDRVYAVEARVKWLNPENNLPSAIVSFWAKNPDNSFRGQDFIITDGNGYKNLRFEFTPSQIGSTRFFLGLFTHVNGNTDDTEIYVDDYKVTEIGELPKGLDTRKGNLLSDGGFDNYLVQPRANQNGWSYTVESPVSGLKQSVINLNGNKKLRLELPKAWDGNEQFNRSVTGVYQNVNLVGGHTYKLSADFQRTTFNQFSSQQDSIAQLIMYRKRPTGEDLFLGPIDVKLTNNNLISKNFSILAPDSGNYTILVRLAGWGNEGNGVAVNVDNVRLLT
jgi:hypothetical protein